VADAPWRCSQCGTVNEPVANACRTCGRWPSLFELEGSTLESEPPLEVGPPEPELYEPEAVEVDYSEQEAYDVGEPVEGYDEPEADEDAEPSKPLWQRLVSLIVPIAVVLYILISALANRGGG
jgi:hypothetical protein